MLSSQHTELKNTLVCLAALVAGDERRTKAAWTLQHGSESSLGVGGRSSGRVAIPGQRDHAALINDATGEGKTRKR